MRIRLSKHPAKFAVRAGLLTLAVLLAGCGGGGGDDVAPPANTVGVSPAQASYDGAVALFDQVPVPVGGAAIITSADIQTTQAAFDKIADSLINL